MSVEVSIPELGESITEAVIAAWLKSDGDIVAVDEPICELETDKANTEMPAPASGAVTLRATVDVSIDIEGSVELSLKSTAPDEPCFVYDPDSGEITMGVSGRGMVIMAVDNLPCELPLEASTHFSDVLKSMIGPLGAADWTASYADLDLPSHLKTAVIAHKGELAPDFGYLAEHVARAMED